MECIGLYHSACMVCFIYFLPFHAIAHTDRAGIFRKLTDFERNEVVGTIVRVCVVKVGPIQLSRIQTETFLAAIVVVSPHNENPIHFFSY